MTNNQKEKNLYLVYLRDGNLRPDRFTQVNQLEDLLSNKCVFFFDSSDSEDRKGFTELCVAIKRNRDATLIVYDLASLDICFKSINNFLNFLALLEESQIALMAFNSENRIPTTASEIIKTFEDVSRRIHREHIQSSLRKRKLNGKSVGRPTERNDKVIQELRGQGYTLREIAQRLEISIGAVQRGLTEVSI